MQPEERQFLLDYFRSSQAHLLALTGNLTPAQWHFHESPERWSIAENIEHCILVEKAITHIIATALAAPAEPEKKAAAPAKEPYVLGVATPKARTRKLPALEAVLPTGRWPDTAELTEKLCNVRARSIAFAAETNADLRDHFLPHQALGDLDCHQWLLVMALHGERHALQIEDIQANPAYPA